MNLKTGRWIANISKSLELFTKIISTEYPEIYQKFLVEKPESENDYKEKIQSIVIYFLLNEKLVFSDRGREMHFFYKIKENNIFLYANENDENSEESILEIKEFNEKSLKIFWEDNSVALALDFENVSFEEIKNQKINNILDKIGIKKENFAPNIPNNILDVLIDKIWSADASQTFVNLLEKTLQEDTERLEELEDEETQNQIMGDIAKENYTFQSDKIYIFQNGYTANTGFYELKEDNFIILYAGEYEIFQKLQILTLDNKNFVFKSWESVSDEHYFTLVYKTK